MNLKASKSRHHPYDAQRNGMNVAAGVGQVSSNSQNGTPGPIRRRISRACDQCNQLRTKCDGKLPCQHCIGIFIIGILIENNILLQGRRIANCF